MLHFPSFVNPCNQCEIRKCNIFACYSDSECATDWTMPSIGRKSIDSVTDVAGFHCHDDVITSL